MTQHNWMWSGQLGYLKVEVNPCFDLKISASISGTTIASRTRGGSLSNSAIVPIISPSYLWEVCYLVSQDLVVQQKFVGLAVVDVYGLENECACTK
ncbi:hypothetical protein Tco_0201744 [Tanacetum coccineum]